MAIDLLVNSQGLEKEFKKALKPMEKFSKQLTAIGKDMSLKVTAPVLGIGSAILKSAGDFEAGMNRVQAITGATSGQFDVLRDKAKELGATTQFSASEAASGIEMLAKNGVKFEAITQGALDATLMLSSATGKDLAGSADIATDAMALFNIEADGMMKAVNGITGVTLNSKFGIDDYALALANGGSAAAAVNVSFEEFNAVIAATASSFSSGMTAGTSFKTLLTRLSPTSDVAAATMERLGLSFFEADGKMKSMAEVADLLQEKLGGLSDEDRINAVRDMFGTEGMKAALALMRSGGEEIQKMQALIGDTSSTEQAEARMKGLNGALKRLQSAAEALAIAIADSGLLEAITGIATRVAGFTARLSETNPKLLNLITIVAATAAAIGPLALAFGTVASAIAPVIAFIAAKGGLVGALAMLTNPIGLVIAAVGALVVAWFKWEEPIRAFVSQFPPMFSAAFDWITDRLADWIVSLGEVKTFVLEAFGKMVTGVAEAMRNIVKSIGDMVIGVKDWLGKKLGDIIDGAISKVKNLGKGFLDLFQKVVGGSYVPDMVDGLAVEFKRMDSTFINPSIAAVKELESQFEKTAASIDGLDFSDIKPLQEAPSLMGPKFDGFFSKGKQTIGDGVESAFGSIDKNALNIDASAAVNSARIAADDISNSFGSSTSFITDRFSAASAGVSQMNWGIDPSAAVKSAGNASAGISESFDKSTSFITDRFSAAAAGISRMDFGIDPNALKDQPDLIDKVLVKPTEKALKDSERLFSKSSLDLSKNAFGVSSTGFVIEGFKNLGLTKSAEKEEQQSLDAVLGQYEGVGERIGGVINRIKEGTDGGLDGVVDFASDMLGEFKGLFGDLDRMGKDFSLSNIFGIGESGAGGLFGKQGIGGLIGNMFGGIGGGGGGGIGSLLKGALSFIPGLGPIASLFGGFFAAGGDPPANRLSLVGEEGPELIGPRSRMRVLPNSAYEAIGRSGGGSKDVTVNLVQNNNFEAGVGADDVAQMLRAHGQNLVSSIKDQIERGGAFRNAFKG